MFNKNKVVGSGRYRVTKKVVDWDAIGGLVVMAVIGLFLLKACTG